jgi:hypothetical protein
MFCAVLADNLAAVQGQYPAACPGGWAVARCGFAGK